MSLGAGEVHESRAVLVRIDDPQIDLHPGMGDDGGLGVATPQHLLHNRQSQEPFHDRPVLSRGHQDVDVADRLPKPAQAPCVLDALHPLDAGQRRDDLQRQAKGGSDRGPAFLAGHAETLDGLDQLLLALGSEAGDIPERLRLDGGPQVVDASDAEFVAQLRHTLGS